MSRKVSEIKDRGLPMMNVSEVAACIFGRSVQNFSATIRYTSKFKREVPDMGNGNRSKYKRSDVLRFYKLRNWYD
ncbi:hypothetical protein WOSG25_021950 [Weissella oryzae SG25]|uniref:DNA-binding protein n=1 Tax=Weissella oryzae (strain DSM 25784 / JCM 18191 / LMG 30913 / SG25) TaxID=1329250 RepID=A0A069CT41_WEIOS|nr:hypothetical protein [Weissella oryzae]GAK30398.1 hypothetical protein WOSG25_021950 [Weissella oryzae SG25]